MDGKGILNNRISEHILTQLNQCWYQKSFSKTFKYERTT